jgi:hypothetical protein
MVGQLRQLVGGTITGSTATPAPSTVLASRVAVFSSPSSARPRSRPQIQKTLTGVKRKAIPMPGDANPAGDIDDDNFKNF